MTRLRVASNRRADWQVALCARGARASSQGLCPPRLWRHEPQAKYNEEPPAKLVGYFFNAYEKMKKPAAVPRRALVCRTGFEPAFALFAQCLAIEENPLPCTFQSAGTSPGVGNAFLPYEPLACDGHPKFYPALSVKLSAVFSIISFHSFNVEKIWSGYKNDRSRAMRAIFGLYFSAFVRPKRAESGKIHIFRYLSK